MCTAISYAPNNQVQYFGRNLDLEYHYNESITITPRNYPFVWRNGDNLPQHYAMIGTSYINGNYPLYYEATNETGLSVAGLSFPDYAFYPLPSSTNAPTDFSPDANEHTKKQCIAPFEVIPYILGQCSNAEQAKSLILNTDIVHIDYSSSLPCTPLHWFVCDKHGSFVIEPLKSGLTIYDNPVGVLTNSPPFDFQMTHLSHYMSVSKLPPRNLLCPDISLPTYSKGMGAMGLPGDLSSASRFVRAAFTKLNSVCPMNSNSTQSANLISTKPATSGSAQTMNSNCTQAKNPPEHYGLTQAFHILDSVTQQRGCVELDPDLYEYTIYSCICDATNGIYYYKTYDSTCIQAVDMHLENLDTNQPIAYPMKTNCHIPLQNQHKSYTQ